VRRSRIAQLGLYTTEAIPKGEMLVEYAGEVVRQSVADVREKRYQKAGLGNYFFAINREYVVDATMCGNISRFINHSCR
jgi:histone-lysine N-methyltransferase SETD1